jgi:signal transduction histidine kinase
MTGDALADRGGGVGPWFRRYPVLAVGVAVALFAGVFGLQSAVHGATDAVTVLFVLPIALLAVAFGLGVGAAAGALGVLLVAMWVAVAGVSLTPLGWVTRATPMLLLGVLVGAASDRLRDAAQAEERLAVAEVREREAAEINDSIVQRLTAAKWALEAGHAERSVELLTESIETAEVLVADLLRGQGGRTVTEAVTVVARRAG